jgi:hypothetical protein
LAATVAGLRLLTLLDYYLQVDRGSLVTTGLIQAAGVLGVGIPLAATTVRAFGQLPPLTATAATTREASLDAADDEEP